MYMQTEENGDEMVQVMTENVNAWAIGQFFKEPWLCAIKSMNIMISWLKQ